MPGSSRGHECHGAGAGDGPSVSAGGPRDGQTADLLGGFHKQRSKLAVNGINWERNGVVKSPGSTPGGRRKSSPAELGSASLALLPRSLMALGESSGGLHCPARVCPPCLPSCTRILSFPLPGRSVLHHVAPSARLPSLAPAAGPSPRRPWRRSQGKVPQMAPLPGPRWADLRAAAERKTLLPVLVANNENSQRSFTTSPPRFYSPLSC